MVNQNCQAGGIEFLLERDKNFVSMVSSVFGSPGMPVIYGAELLNLLGPAKIPSDPGLTVWCLGELGWALYIRFDSFLCLPTWTLKLEI